MSRNPYPKAEVVTFDHREPVAIGERCEATMGTVYTGPKACGRVATIALVTGTGERIGCCRLHLRRVDEHTKSFGATR